MCKHLVSLVYGKKAGSAVRKAVLGYMADRASEDGDGIYTSKGRISRETEVSESAVKKAIREFLSEGLIIEVGTRSHANGKTTVYAIVRERIEALEDVKAPTTYSATPAPVDPVPQEPRHPETPTPAPENPHPGTECPQTTLNHPEPPKDQPAPDLLVGPQDEVTQDRPPTFPEFWEAWPLAKQGKKKAEAAFRRLSAHKRTEATRRCGEWARRWRQTHPQATDVHPTTYLNGERWLDEFGPSSSGGSASQPEARTVPRSDWRSGAQVQAAAAPPPPANRARHQRMKNATNQQGSH